MDARRHAAGRGPRALGPGGPHAADGRTEPPRRTGPAKAGARPRGADDRRRLRRPRPLLQRRPDPLPHRRRGAGLLGGAGLLLYLAAPAADPERARRCRDAEPGGRALRRRRWWAWSCCSSSPGPFFSAAASSLQPFSSPSRPSLSQVFSYGGSSREKDRAESRGTSRCERRSASGSSSCRRGSPSARRSPPRPAGGGTIVAVAADRGGRGAGGRRVRPARCAGSSSPPCSLGLSAGSVGAAGVSLDGGVGERHYRPASMADLRDQLRARAWASWTSTSATSTCRRATRRSRSTWASATCGSTVPADVCVATRGRHRRGRGARARRAPTTAWT